MTRVGRFTLRDHVGHGEGLAGAGDAEQHLVLSPAPRPVDELVDGRGLVAPRLEVAHQLEAGVGLRGSEARLLRSRPAHGRAALQESGRVEVKREPPRKQQSYRGASRVTSAAGGTC